MKILHLIRNPGDETPLRVAAIQSRWKKSEIRVVFIQDGVYRPGAGRRGSLACREDSEARCVAAGKKLASHSEIAEMILEFDTVVTW